MHWESAGTCAFVSYIICFQSARQVVKGWDWHMGEVGSNSCKNIVLQHNMQK